MTMKITTHYKQALTSQMLNYKVETMVGDNKVVEGFQVSRNDNNITISPGKCIINGAIIESDEDVTIEVPYSLQGSSDFQVIAQYLHSAKSVRFYIYEIDRNLDGNELLLSKSMTDASKMRTLTDLSASLKSIKENLAEDQVLEYENEFITSTDSVEGATTELKIKGQTILNVAPIKDEVDVYADLQATSGGSVKFNNTGDGIIDGINIKGKTYQNLGSGFLTAPSNDNYSVASGLRNSIVTIKVDGEYNIYTILTMRENILIRPNKSYTLLFKQNGRHKINAAKIKNFDSNTDYTLSWKRVNDNMFIVTTSSNKAIGSGRIDIVLERGLQSYSTGDILEVNDLIILEGDHTANPDLPTYFEGIKGVGDKCRNLFNERTDLRSAYVGGDDSVTYTNDPSGEAKCAVIKCKPNTTYTITKSNITERFSVSTSDKPLFNGDKVKNIISLRNNISITYTTNATAEYLVVYYMLNSFTNPCHNLQIEEGAISTPYEKHYEGHKVEVKSCGKNLFNCNWVVGSINQANGMDNDYDSRVRSDGFIEVLVGKTYTFSNNGIIRGTNVFLYDSNFNYISCLKTANMVTIPPGIKYMKLMGNPDNRDMFQIEEGDTATAYEPYKESKVTHYLREPLMSLPNGVCDEIVGNKVIKRVDKLVLDGTENWGGFIIEPSGLGRMVCFNIRGLKLGGALVCDKLIPINWGDKPWESDNICISALTSHSHIYIYLKDIANIDEGKAWLAQNPTTVYYELAEPIITPIDNDVVMPNGVHDEITRDKAIRKVRKRILDGTEEWNASGSNPGTSDYVVFYHNKYDPHNFDGITIGAEGDFLCDGIFEPKVCRQDTSLDSSSVTGEYITGHFSENIDEIRISILKRRLDTLDAAGFRKWLSENPTTIWYELRNSYEGPADNSVILPNGVRDGYVDGKVIRKIKKVILTGNEGWESITDTWGTSDSLAFKIAFPDMKKYKYDIPRGCVLSDKFISFRDYTLYNDSSILEGICSDVLNINIRIAKSRLQTQDTAGFKKWLSENPTTIWYELKEPYYDIVRNPHLKSFAPETNITGSTLVPTPFNIESYGYRKEALIKPNTQYTIHFNNKYADANFKNIKVDLGGAIGNVTANNSWLMLKLTTPATLSHNELRISGYGIKVSNVMCSEGSNCRDFIDGLAGVGDKSKNLFNGELQKGYWYNGSLKPSEYAIANIHNIKIKPETSYTFSIEDYNGIIYIAELDSSFNEIKAYQIKTKQSITTSIGSYLRFCTANDELYKLSVNTKVQIEEGSIATSYEPYYDGNKIEVLSYGKNLCPYKDASFIGINDRPWVDMLGKTGVYGPNVASKTKTWFYLPEGYYRASYIKNNCLIQVINKKEEIIDFNKYVNAQEVCVRVKPDAVNSNYSVSNLMIERVDAPGLPATNFMPYKEDKTQILLQEPLHSLPNGVCDTIEKIDGQYVVVRRCGEITLGGDGDRLNWIFRSQSSSSSQIRAFKADSSWLNMDKIVAYTPIRVDKCVTANHAWDAAWWDDKFADFAINNNNNVPGSIELIFRLRCGVTEIDSFNKYMKNNPVKLIYKLATPTIHPLNYLRLPNGVADEIKDGKRIRKVGKVVLDGSENWQVYKDDGNYITFTVLTDTVFDNAAHPISNSVTNVLSPSFKSVPNENNGRFMFNCISLNPWDSFWVRIQTNQLETPNVAGFKKWLSENPTTVWYELKTPTEEDYISPNLNLDTYEETTHIKSNTLVPAIINAKIPTNIGTVIKNDIRRIEVIEDLIDKVILPQLVESHYEKTLLEFDYQVSRMLK